MSTSQGQNHSNKEQGKSTHNHDKDKTSSSEGGAAAAKQRASPTKWRNATSPATGHNSSSSPGHNPGVGSGPGPSSNPKSLAGNVGGIANAVAGKTAHTVKKLLFGKEEQKVTPGPGPAPPVHVPPITPPELAALAHLEIDGASADLIIGNAVIPNGTLRMLGTSQEHYQLGVNGGLLSDNSGTENYNSDQESGSSITSGGGGGGSGPVENNGESPTHPQGSCAAAQTHISALPENVLENIFTFLELTDVRNSNLVCREWGRVISDENNEVWRTQCFKRMSREVVYSELLSTCPSFKAKLRAHIHAWNPLDCSRNIYVKPNGLTIHRNPVAQSTDGARGKIGFNQGRHAWEIIWEGPLGTVAVVGVATQQAEMRAQGYIALLGRDDQSWGWNLVENLLLHNGDSQGNYPVINNAPRYQVGERIRVILDCEDNTLSFEKNFEFLGVAFRGLPNREKLYPAVSAVYGNTEISMVYLGPPLDG